uniref:Uncharacterized protein n=1 Tax=Physcomitrium patens TaxID=3218 RepID=A0A2K1K841_PHYPA|nr:hypothetical protein PHYPA_011845 [Physcomitrium patens]
MLCRVAVTQILCVRTLLKHPAHHNPQCPQGYLNHQGRIETCPSCSNVDEP